MVERDELQEKLTKLSTFLRGPEQNKPASQQYKLLMAQEDAMADYLHILNERIAIF